MPGSAMRPPRSGDWIQSVNRMAGSARQMPADSCHWIRPVPPCDDHHAPMEGREMPDLTPLDPAAEWVELVATDADWDAAEPHLLTSMLSQLVLIRTFEEFVL